MVSLSDLFKELESNVALFQSLQFSFETNPYSNKAYLISVENSWASWALEYF